MKIGCSSSFSANPMVGGGIREKMSSFFLGLPRICGYVSYEAHLHQAYKPCFIGAIPSQTYGNVWWSPLVGSNK